MFNSQDNYAGPRMWPFWNLLELWMEVVVTAGNIRREKLWSNRHHQQINTQHFYRHALPVTQPTVSKHRRGNITFHGLAHPKLTWGSSNLIFDHLKAPDYLGEGCKASCQQSVHQTLNLL